MNKSKFDLEFYQDLLKRYKEDPDQITKDEFARYLDSIIQEFGFVIV